MLVLNGAFVISLHYVIHFFFLVDLPSRSLNLSTQNPCYLKEKHLHQEPCSSGGTAVRSVSLLTGLKSRTMTTLVLMQKSLLWILHLTRVKETHHWAPNPVASQRTAAGPSSGKIELLEFPWSSTLRLFLTTATSAPTPTMIRSLPRLSHRTHGRIGRGLLVHLRTELLSPPSWTWRPPPAPTLTARTWTPGDSEMNNCLIHFIKYQKLCLDLDSFLFWKHLKVLNYTDPQFVLALTAKQAFKMLHILDNVWRCFSML